MRIRAISTPSPGRVAEIGVHLVELLQSDNDGDALALIDAMVRENPVTIGDALALSVVGQRMLTALFGDHGNDRETTDDLIAITHRLIGRAIEALERQSGIAATEFLPPETFVN